MQPSITELRGLAQALKIPFTFADDAKSLQQKIDLKANTALERPEPPPAYIPEDARLRLKPPSNESERKEVDTMLKEHIARGLRITYADDDQWHMRFAAREDSGSLRVPLRVMLGVANRLMA